MSDGVLQSTKHQTWLLFFNRAQFPNNTNKNTSEQFSWFENAKSGPVAMFGLLLQSIRFQPERAHLPALVCGAIVGIVFGDMGVDATESQLFVWGR